MNRMTHFGAVSFVLFVTLGASAQEGDPTPYGDEPPTSFQQVQIHVWISETTEDGLREIGNNLTYKRFVRGVEQTGSLQQVNTQVFDPQGAFNTVTLPAPDPTMFDPPLRPDQGGNLADGIQTQTGAGLTYSIIDSEHGTLDGVFRAVERKTDVDLISKPELLVIDGQTAQIHAGTEFPYQDVAFDAKGVPRLNVEWENLGVVMQIQPNIRTDDLIELDIQNLEVSDIARIDNIRGVDLPVFSTRSQTGPVLVPNGRALVIGGLSSRVIRKSERRVPLIGRIPLLGIPFRGRSSEASNTLLLIFVQPTIVDLRELTPAASSALEFWRDGGWRNTETIEREIEALKVE